MSRRIWTRLGLAWADRSLRTKGLIVVAIPLAALLVVAPFSYLSQRRSQRSDLLVRHTLQVQSEIKQVLVSLLSAETGVRGYLATGNDEFLTPYRDAQKSLFVSLDRLAALLQDDPVQIARVREADTLALQELDLSRPSVSFARYGPSIRRGSLLSWRQAIRAWTISAPCSPPW